MFDKFKACGRFWFHCWHYDQYEHYVVKDPNCKENRKASGFKYHCCRCREIKYESPYEGV